MKIAFLSSGDPSDVKTWSGIPHFIFNELSRRFDEVVYVPARLSQLFGKGQRAAVRSGIKNGLSLETLTAAARLGGRDISSRINRVAPDLVFGLTVSPQIAYLDVNVPVAYSSDATFAAMRNYYPRFQGMTDFSARQADNLERRSIDRADVLLYPSHWAAESAKRDYQAAPDKVSVIPYGANLSTIPARKDVLSSKPRNICQLLFVGADWNRKGGDIALEMIEALETRGVPSRLVAVGDTPKGGGLNGKAVFYSFLNKQSDGDRAILEKLYRESHFFVMPTKMEAYGVVFCEAAAHGLPSLSYATGGVPTILQQNDTGVMLAPGADAGAFADTIAEIWNDPDRYRSMCLASRDAYDTRLNWGAWGDRVEPILRAAAL